MNKTTSSGGPEESWDPFVYLAPTELNDLLAKRRIRDAKENILLKVDCFSEATGSSYIEIGKLNALIRYLLAIFAIPRNQKFIILILTNYKILFYQ